MSSITLERFATVYNDLTEEVCCPSVYEPHREKTGFLHMRKQRRRSAVR